MRWEVGTLLYFFCFLSIALVARELPRPEDLLSLSPEEFMKFVDHKENGQTIIQTANGNYQMSTAEFNDWFDVFDRYHDSPQSRAALLEDVLNSNKSINGIDASTLGGLRSSMDVTGRLRYATENRDHLNPDAHKQFGYHYVVTSTMDNKKKHRLIQLLLQDRLNRSVKSKGDFSTRFPRALPWVAAQFPSLVLRPPNGANLNFEQFSSAENHVDFKVSIGLDVKAGGYFELNLPKGNELDIRSFQFTIDTEYGHKLILHGSARYDPKYLAIMEKLSEKYGASTPKVNDLLRTVTVTFPDLEKLMLALHHLTDARANGLLMPNLNSMTKQQPQGQAIKTGAPRAAPTQKLSEDCAAVIIQLFPKK